MWDLRARSLVYDLSTGNNAVQSLAWDSDGNSLYAATDCPYVDRHGNHHDYRYAKVPKKNRPVKKDDVEMEHDDGDEELSDREFDSEDSDFEDDNECTAWPKNAYHDENYYGHLFDSGEHRLCKSLSRSVKSVLIVFQSSTRSRPMPTHRSCRRTETRLLGNGIRSGE